MNGIINNKTGKFYVFGGLSDQFTGTENIIALNDMNIFDTISLTWCPGQKTARGVILENRNGHSAVLRLNYQIKNLKPFFYILDVRNFTWVTQFEPEQSPVTTNSVTPITTATITNTSSTNLTAKKSGQIGIILGAVGLSVVNIIFAGFLGYKFYKKQKNNRTKPTAED
ncbi:hypothetical protein RhiirA4_525830 [Rhizophagus irregularis]|uniref:Uncharacterized protein n=1 Tax=Rhizophagus irregularis TaxID=588596 RepID=A0A2I1GPY5_9GLOM|nr:hypothetical protein RhiirA4_525830 [Rhizophagus irregularis]